jgi:hypothetical protein
MSVPRCSTPRGMATIRYKPGYWYSVRRHRRVSGYCLWPSGGGIVSKSPRLSHLVVSEQLSPSPHERLPPGDREGFGPIGRRAAAPPGVLDSRRQRRVPQRAVRGQPRFFCRWASLVKLPEDSTGPGTRTSESRPVSTTTGCPSPLEGRRQRLGLDSPRGCVVAPPSPTERSRARLARSCRPPCRAPRTARLSPSGPDCGALPGQEHPDRVDVPGGGEDFVDFVKALTNSGFDAKPYQSVCSEYRQFCQPFPESRRGCTRRPRGRHSHTNPGHLIYACMDANSVGPGYPHG